MTNRIIKILLCNLLFVFSTWAQTQLQLTINPTKGTPNTQFNITVEVDGSELFSTPSIEDYGDFKLQYIGPEQQVSIINGRISSKSSYRYIGTAQVTGTAHLPTFSMKIGGQNFYTPKRTIEILKTAHDTSTTEEHDVSIKVEPSKTTVFSGEQLVLKTTLETKVLLEGVQMPNPSSIDFWSEKFGQDKQYRQETYQGDMATMLENTHAIFPLQPSGKLTIKPMLLTAQAQSRQAANILDPFNSLGGFFGGSILQRMLPFGLQPITLSTKELEINIVPLPPKTKSISDKEIKTNATLVGPTTWDVNIDDFVLEPGKETILTIKIQTFGNVNALKNLSLPEIQNFNLEFKDESIHKTEKDFQLYGTYITKYSVTPNKNGMLYFPPISLPYFDPFTGQHSILASSGFTVTAQGFNEHIPEPISDHSTIQEKDSSHLPSGAGELKQKVKLSKYLVAFLIAVIIFLLFRLFNNKPKTLTKKNRKPFVLPAKKTVTNYEQLNRLVAQFQNTYGDIHSKGLSRDTKAALDILTEARYNPQFIHNEKIFLTVRDTIYYLCQSKQKALKKLFL